MKDLVDGKEIHAFHVTISGPVTDVEVAWMAWNILPERNIL